MGNYNGNLEIENAHKAELEKIRIRTTKIIYT